MTTSDQDHDIKVYFQHTLWLSSRACSCTCRIHLSGPHGWRGIERQARAPNGAGPVVDLSLYLQAYTALSRFALPCQALDRALTRSLIANIILKCSKRRRICMPSTSTSGKTMRDTSHLLRKAEHATPHSPAYVTCQTRHSLSMRHLRSCNHSMQRITIFLPSAQQSGQDACSITISLYRFP